MCNTSYNDLLEITPRERDYMLEFISEEAKVTKEMMDEIKSNR